MFTREETLEYLVKYLNRQLATARKIKDEANAKLEAEPDSFVASVSVEAASNRITMLRKYKETAGNAKGRVLHVATKPIAPGKTTLRHTSNMRGDTTPKYRNSDHCLDKLVKKKAGILLVCNLKLLWS